MAVFNNKLPKVEYFCPKTIDETVSLLKLYKGEVKVFAGGTDLFPQMKKRQIGIPKYLIDLKGLQNLDYIICDDSEGLRIGALTTIASVESSPIIKEKFSALGQAAHVIGSSQVRNRGTISGNICNAAPSADSAPALLSLDARLKIIGVEGQKTISIEEFFTGRSETIIADEELLIEIQIPSIPLGSRSIYLKLSPRCSMDLAVVGVAVSAVFEEGICKDIKIALGAVAPIPIRAKAAENIIRGKKISDEIIEQVAKTAVGEIQPNKRSYRASTEYREEMVNVLVKRAIIEMIS